MACLSKPYLLPRLLFDPAKARPLNFAKVRHAKFARKNGASAFAKPGAQT